MDHHACAARSSDICSLKKQLHEYIPSQITRNGDTIPPPDPKDCNKVNSGYNMMSTA